MTNNRQSGKNTQNIIQINLHAYKITPTKVFRATVIHFYDGITLQWKFAPPDAVFNNWIKNPLHIMLT